MLEALSPFYLWLKAFHIVAVIAWMCGMLYLPRLYVYHCEVEPRSAESARFKTMERRLLRAIVNPAMIATWLLGLALVLTPASGGFVQGWLHAKLALVIGMTVVHVIFSKWRKDFERDVNRHEANFYRAWNEVPTVLMIAIVILVVVKPF